MVSGREGACPALVARRVIGIVIGTGCSGVRVRQGGGARPKPDTLSLAHAPYAEAEHANLLDAVARPRLEECQCGHLQR